MSKLAVLAAVVAAALVAVPPATARATPQDVHLAGSGHTVTVPGTGPRWFGAHSVSGRTGYCIDLMSTSPAKASSWTPGSSTPVPKQSGLAKNALPHGNGHSVLSERERAEVAWLLHDTGTSPGADTAAAVDHAIRLRTIEGPAQQGSESRRWAAVTAAHPRAKVEFDRLHRDAVRYAGPYTRHVTWVRQPTATDPAGEVSVRVTAASGAVVPNSPLSLTTHGDLAITGEPTTTGPSGTVTVRVMATGDADTSRSGSVQVSLTGLAGASPTVLVPHEKTVQRIVVAAPAVHLDTTLTVRLAPKVYAPTVSTRTATPVAAAGSRAVDIVTTSGGRPGGTFTGSSTLYGPFETLDALRASSATTAPKVGMASFKGTWDVSGRAEVRTDDSLTFPQEGYYVWVERLDGTSTITAPSTPAWPQLPEVSLVVRPTVATELSGAAGEAPGTANVSDALRVDGIPGRVAPATGKPLTVLASGRLLGPVPPREEGGAATCEDVDWSAAPTIGSYDSTEVPTSGLAGLLPTTVTEPGCYTADASVSILVDGRTVTTVEHAPGITSQTFLLDKPALASPTPSPSPSTSPSPSPGPSGSVTVVPTPSPSPSVSATPTPTPTPTPAPAEATPAATVPRINAGDPSEGASMIWWVASAAAVGTGALLAGRRS